MHSTEIWEKNKTAFVILCPHNPAQIITTINSVLMETEDSKSSCLEIVKFLEDWFSFVETGLEAA